VLRSGVLRGLYRGSGGALGSVMVGSYGGVVALMPLKASAG
jgi:hypothetical protein